MLLEKETGYRRDYLPELELHRRLEEEIFYPAVSARANQEVKELVIESLEEHQEVGALIEELRDLDPEEPVTRRASPSSWKAFRSTLRLKKVKCSWRRKKASGINWTKSAADGRRKGTGFHVLKLSCVFASSVAVARSKALPRRERREDVGLVSIAARDLDRESHDRADVDCSRLDRRGRSRASALAMAMPAPV